MSDPTSDLVADATEPIDGAEPERSQQPLEIDHVRQPRPPARTHHHGQRLIAGTDMTVVPAGTEIEALAQFAVTLAASATAPKALQNNVNDAFMVLLTARDLGVALTTAVREFHVIDGKVTISPKAKKAMVHQQGIGKVFPHQAPRQVWAGDRLTTRLCPCGDDGSANDDTSATWHGERADDPGILHTSTFTIAMAQRVKAKESGVKITLDQKSTWKQYPQRMLSWRALGYLLDDVFSEVGTGLYSPDEMGAVTDEEGVPIIDVVGTSGPVRGTNAPRGHNQPPPPPEPDATQDELAALQARIDALKVLPDARTALVTLWTKPKTGQGGEDTNEPTLPPLRYLKAKQVKMADAMLASIEQRARKGEWGTWDETPAEPASDDAPADDTAGDEPPADERTEQQIITQRVIAEVQAMEPSTLNEQLTAADLVTTGNLDTRRHRLAMHMIAAAGVES